MIPPDEELSAEEAERIVLLKRESFRSTLETLQARVSEEAHNVQAVVERAKEGLERSGAVIREHRWSALAVAVGVGLLLGTRRGRRQRRDAVRIADATNERMLVLVRPDELPSMKRPSFWKGVLGTVGGILAKQVADLAAESFQRWQEQQHADDREHDRGPDVRRR